MDRVFDKVSLKHSYEKRFEDALMMSELSNDNIKESLGYFEADSIIAKQFIPKKLHTYCVVAGVPFDSDTIDFIQLCCSRIKHVLHKSDTYFVKPQNFGLELLVIKWPDENLSIDRIQQRKCFLADLADTKIQITIEGFQFHSDGCIVLRGYDSLGKFQNIRYQALKNIQNLPKKQSSWCHIPIGRILSPVYPCEYAKLKDLTLESHDSWHHTFTLRSLRLLDERRWYQEEKIELFEKILAK